MDDIRPAWNEKTPLRFEEKKHILRRTLGGRTHVTFQLAIRFGLAALFLLLFTPWVTGFARRVGAIDQPGKRTAHARDRHASDRPRRHLPADHPGARESGRFIGSRATTAGR